MPEALYYPWIDVRDDPWLKTSLLYWDAVRTIVPESIEEPYRSDVGRELQQAKFLVPVRVHSGMDEVESLTEDTLAYLGTREGGNLLLSNRRGEVRHIHAEKLPYKLGRLARIHPEKFPREIRHLLEEFAGRRGSEWLAVDDGFANFYMTLLATRLSERLGISLLTPLPSADSLAVTVILPRRSGHPPKEPSGSARQESHGHVPQKAHA